MNISGFSTQSRKEYGIQYNNRTEDDVYNLINYTLKGNNANKPLYNGALGFTYKASPREIAREMLSVQTIYGKEKGIRIRGEVINIGKDELLVGQELQQIQQIACGFGKYLFFKGFQVTYGIFDCGTSFNINYSINSVSYGDGTKYRHNNADIKDDQMECLKCILAEVTGNDTAPHFDFSVLEYY